MSTKIFVNLPVKDLAKSIAFFSRLGYTVDSRFTDDNAGCLVISDSIFAMLLTESSFKAFTEKEIPDTTTSAQAILALGLDSRAEVDELVAKAVAAGATEPRGATDEGFLYGRSFADLDGHLWEAFWMDPAALQG
ncbi:VOC family protein [Kitasatospora sp. NPDC091207]|uniref:VOC family protein n=1 Tax=Kitasatospora sp. NPDC091207 TaxID=3364083 RepID=UPI00380EA865